MADKVITEEVGIIDLTDKDLEVAEELRYLRAEVLRLRAELEEARAVHEAMASCAGGEVAFWRATAITAQKASANWANMRQAGINPPPYRKGRRR